MVLIETDPVLPTVVEAIRARVLVFFSAMQPVREFTTATDLREFLDMDVLDEMERIGVPRFLTNVTLIYKSAAAFEIVADRMAPDAPFTVFHAPECWRYFGPRLTEMRELAERYEPAFVRAALARM